MEGRDDAIKYPELGSTPLLTALAAGRGTWRLYQLCFPWLLTLARKLFVMVERAEASMQPDLTVSLKNLSGKG